MMRVHASCRVKAVVLIRQFQCARIAVVARPGNDNRRHACVACPFQYIVAVLVETVVHEVCADVDDLVRHQPWFQRKNREPNARHTTVISSSAPRLGATSIMVAPSNITARDDSRI